MRSWSCAGPLLGRALAIYFFSVLPGCLIPYAFPKVDQTPLSWATEETNEIHVFRVDVTRDFIDIGGTDSHTLSEVKFLPGGWVLPQTKVSATYGLYVFGIVLNYPAYISHSLELHLYRPGHKLVDLESWQLPKAIAWEKVDGLQAQEQTLDRLFLVAEADRADKRLEPPIRARLSPGSVSVEHRKALLYGASEYERLASTSAASAPENQEVYSRLLTKAKELRDLAGMDEP
jgi:hypothetical protein